MYFGNEGRKDYLDFVKNIPIQAFFFFLGALFLHGGVMGHPTVAKSIAGIILWLMGAGAAVASTSLFVESLRDNLIRPETERALERYPRIEGKCFSKSAAALAAMLVQKEGIRGNLYCYIGD